MQLEIDLPSEVPRGRPVPIDLRLINPGRESREVVLQGRPTAFDITVTRLDGTPVWRRLDREVVAAILQLRTFAARETLGFHAVWNQRDSGGTLVPPGDYLVRGGIPSDPPAVFQSAAVPLRVVP